LNARSCDCEAVDGAGIAGGFCNGHFVSRDVVRHDDAVRGMGG
jgi:hypothetical protein